MPENIDTEVKTFRDSTSDEDITVLLGVSGDRDAFTNHVENAGATVEAKLGQSTLRVTAPVAAIDRLCELSGLKSIEIEREDVRSLDEEHRD